jgi:hypothetical protein
MFYFVTKFFEVTVTRDPDTNKVIVAGSALRQNHLYVTIYVVWSKLILTDVLPYLVFISMSIVPKS